MFDTEYIFRRTDDEVFVFADYEEFIYLNTNLPKRDARLIARECWNKGMTKQEALKEAKALYA